MSALDLAPVLACAAAAVVVVVWPRLGTRMQTFMRVAFCVAAILLLAAAVLEERP